MNTVNESPFLLKEDRINSPNCKITCSLWGEYEGELVYLFKMESEDGAFVELTNYGASIVSVFVPDKHNKLGNVVLGFPTLEEYITDNCYIGATIGRVANRIGNASFRLGEEHFQLERNDGFNTNHGGNNGFNSRVFNFSLKGETLTFTLFSKDGEGGYPGNLQLEVIYSWNAQHELSIQYAATTDKETIANFTNHAYFNLAAGKGNIFGHELTINAPSVLEAGEDYIPTGEIVPAANKIFDGHRIREKLTCKDNRYKGLNTYYVLDKTQPEQPACILYSSISGRQLEVFTSYPGVLLYTGDYLTSNYSSWTLTCHKPFDGLCLECQHYPDAPSHANFPSVVLAEGQVYKEYIMYKFSVNNKTSK